MVGELVLCALVAPLLGTFVMRLLADRVAAGIAVVAFTVSACLLALGTALVLLAGGIHTTTALVNTGKRGWTAEAWADAGQDMWLSGPCALVAVLAGVSAGRAWRRQRTALRAAGVEAAALPGEDVVVVVPGKHPDAFTLPGSPGRIVVTESMRAALSPDELGVVLAHERAHLRGRHHRYVDATRLAAAGQPLLRPVARLVEYGVERWADERAAVEVGDRVRVARAIGTVALVTAATGPPSSPGSASTGSRCPAGHTSLGAAPSALRIATPDWLAEPEPSAATVSRRARRGDPVRRPPRASRTGRAPRPGPVPRRVRALLRPLPASSHLMLLTIPAFLSLGSCFFAGNICYDLHLPLAMALELEAQF
ncbi:M56 family metallopeptidase [Pseudofrankia saprophytica]|uniref:M56 family metallopeptidase n=1 Tax=Pseudofrankia saprophytica TaxID=298655 RepID=UPI000234BD03|nr:M56 family metallopeptidase [Pseudofrankia saprophytica]